VHNKLDIINYGGWLPSNHAADSYLRALLHMPRANPGQVAAAVETFRDSIKNEGLEPLFNRVFIQARVFPQGPQSQGNSVCLLYNTFTEIRNS
jgi:hypothetical protein